MIDCVQICNKWHAKDIHTRMQGMPNIISISILTGLKQTCKRSYRAHRKLGSGVEWRERERERVDEEKVKMRVSY